jgi:hypothetical protein
VTWYNLDLEEGCPFGDRSGNRGKCGVGQTSDGRLLGRCFADPQHTFADFMERLGIDAPLETSVGKAVVIVSDRELNEVSSDCWRHIAAGNAPPTLFLYGGRLTEFTDADGPMLTEVSRDRLSYILDRTVALRRFERGGHRTTNPPLRLLADLLAELRPPVPKLVGLVTAPFFSPSGRLVVHPGFDEETALYYEPRPSLAELAVPGSPTHADVSKAVSTLRDALVDFPFLDETRAIRAADGQLLGAALCGHGADSWLWKGQVDRRHLMASHRGSRPADAPSSW